MRTKPGQRFVKMKDKDLKNLKAKIDKESEAIRNLAIAGLALSRAQRELNKASQIAEQAQDARDKQCLKIETDYKIPRGTKWLFNRDSGGIDLPD